MTVMIFIVSLLVYNSCLMVVVVVVMVDMVRDGGFCDGDCWCWWYSKPVPKPSKSTHPQGFHLG